MCDKDRERKYKPSMYAHFERDVVQKVHWAPSQLKEQSVQSKMRQEVTHRLVCPHARNHHLHPRLRPSRSMTSHDVLLIAAHPMAALYCNTYYKSVPHVVQYNAPVHRVWYIVIYCNTKLPMLNYHIGQAINKFELSLNLISLTTYQC